MSASDASGRNRGMKRPNGFLLAGDFWKKMREKDAVSPQNGKKKMFYRDMVEKCYPP